MKPKAFISYSWTSQSHQEKVRGWADRLRNDGVDVVFDLYDLKPGDEKYVFMERMVNDPEITHVLVFSDKQYATRANAREAGVGTESQIISKEIYEKVEQSKFIPIVCDSTGDETPCLPTFLGSRMWIDFSTSEAVEDHWKDLIHRLYDKPLYQIPQLGEIPGYIREDSAPPSIPALAKYSTLRQAILGDKKGIELYRKDFLDACIDYADSLRVRERPNLDTLGEKVLEDCGKLLHVRNHIVDWVLLESKVAPSKEFSEALNDTLERLRGLKSAPIESHRSQHTWLGAHYLFVYETFLYLVAALLETRAYEDLHNIFTSRYLRPVSARGATNPFYRFDTFRTQSETLSAAELVRTQAQRQDLPFSSILQADLLVFLMALITPDTYWLPQTLSLAGSSSDFPFFLRASQHKNFEKLATITGIDDADALREAVKQGYERLQIAAQGHTLEEAYWKAMNMDSLDSIK